MKYGKLFCYKCGNEMPFFRSEEGGVTEGINYCVNPDCELLEMQQPQSNGQSIVSFNGDGNITVIRKGGFSRNEDNLEYVRAAIERHIPKMKTIRKVDSHREAGADLMFSCSGCSIDREIQVTRVLDADYARSSDHSDVAWKTYTPYEILEILIKSINRKTCHYSPSSIKNMILVLDPTVDSFWSVIFKMDLNKLKNYLSDYQWFSVVMLGTEHTICLVGSDLYEWCNCQV